MLPMDHDSFKCPVCDDYEVDNLNSLRIHAQKKHNLSARDLCIWLFHGDVEPKCACGCGQVPNFWTLQKGFAEYVLGHHSRVKNNWGHNEAALAKSKDVRREQIAAGEWQAWNKGETKETDDRVASLGQKQSSNFTPARRAKRGEIMTKSWQTGAITPLTGSAHSQWKGGVSSVQTLSRSYVFNVWTYPKLLASNFTCQGCGSKSDLEVHHDKERFAEILQKARLALGDVTDDFASHQSYARWVADYHIDNEVSGIVLCEGCHLEAHVGKEVAS